MPDKPAKKNTINDLLNRKGPSMLRQSIQPIDIIESAAQKTDLENRSEDKPDIPDAPPAGQSDARTDLDRTSDLPSDKANVKNPQKVESKKPSSLPRKKEDREKRTKKPRIYSERDIHALLAVEKRETIRYSFEAFADQKEDIQRICDLYEASTGKKLSASRLLREVLDSFLPGALKALDSEE